MSTPATDVVTPTETPITPDARLKLAEGLVLTYTKWAAAGGLVPVPLLDVATIAAVQLRMLEKLAHLYGVTFSKNTVKQLVGTLVASVLPYNVASGTAASLSGLIRFVPVVGQIVGIGILPAFASASTFALGRVFITHFESGGTFLNFDPAQARAAFEKQFAAEKQSSAAHPTDVTVGVPV